MVMFAAAGPSDADLCRAVRAGDRSAADALVRRHTGLVKKAVLRRVSFLRAEADDAMQAGRLALLAAAREYDPAGGTRYGTFAHRAVVWAVTSALTRDAGDLTLDDPAPFDALPAAEPAERPALPGWFRMAMARLPARHRRVLALLYGLDGEAEHDAAAAAARLGMSDSAIRAVHRRILAELRPAGAGRATTSWAAA